MKALAFHEHGGLQTTGRRGVDVVLENVGAATWKGAIRTVAKGGRIVTCGATSGPWTSSSRGACGPSWTR